MKNIGMKVALAAVFVNGPRFVLTFLLADGVRLPVTLEAVILAITGIATGLVLTGGGAYIAHEILQTKGRTGARIFMGVTWVALLIFAVQILAPQLVAGMKHSDLAEILKEENARWRWAVISVVAVEVLAAGAMVAQVVSELPDMPERTGRPSAWKRISEATGELILAKLTGATRKELAPVTDRPNRQVKPPEPPVRTEVHLPVTPVIIPVSELEHPVTGTFSEPDMQDGVRLSAEERKGKIIDLANRTDDPAMFSFSALSRLNGVSRATAKKDWEELLASGVISSNGKVKLHELSA